MAYVGLGGRSVARGGVAHGGMACGGMAVGAWLMGAWFVGAWLVGAWLVGAWLVGAWLTYSLGWGSTRAASPRAGHGGASAGRQIGVASAAPSGPACCSVQWRYFHRHAPLPVWLSSTPCWPRCRPWPRTSRHPGGRAREGGGREGRGEREEEGGRGRERKLREGHGGRGEGGREGGGGGGKEGITTLLVYSKVHNEEECVTSNARVPGGNL